MTSHEHPKKIDKYRIDSVLGQGAMGIVYKSYDSEIERFVAIKVLHHHLLNGDMGKELEQRFKHEVKAAAKCLHQNIVTIFDCGLCHGRPYMVMEYVQGIDLRLMLKSQHIFSINQAIGIVIKILDALFAAHRLGVVHRDIKPANILLLDNGIVKVTDFGVARIDNSDLTQIGDVIGTPSYMSPEAHQGALVDNRSDLYSTALVLLELLTHERYKSNEINAENIISHIQVLELNAKQKNDLCQTIIKALERNPESRYQTAVDFSKSLLNCLASIEDPYQQANDLAETVIQIKTKLPEVFSKDSESSQVSCLSSLNNEELSLVEKNLTKYVGPIAKVLLKKQARHSDNIEHLLDSLSSKISSTHERQEFINNLQSSGFFKSSHSSSFTSSTGNSSVIEETNSHINGKLEFSDSEISHLTKNLTIYLGPVAKHVIKSALKKSSSLEQFQNSLAEKIPDNQQRTEFLKKCEFKT